jgi:biopolymer transport protein ExbD
VEVTALVDVVFLLLIFFIISSSMVFWPGTRVETEVELPKSRVVSMSAADKLVITITRSDLLFFNDNPISWDELERELNEVVVRSRVVNRRRSDDEIDTTVRTPQVVLRADRRIPYEKIIEITSLARTLGLDVYLVTDPENGVGRPGTATPTAGGS